MARSFDGASYLARAQFLTAYPFTMACWFNRDVTVTKALMSQGWIDDATVDRHMLFVDSDGDGKAVGAQSIVGAGNGKAASTVGVTNATWQHAAGVWAAAADRRVYLDGGNKGTNATSVSFGTHTAFRVGVLANLDLDWKWSGRIAEAAVWDVALTDDEVASLSKGFSPLLIRPQSLVSYWPLFGNDSPELDRGKSRFDLTLTGTSKGDHTRMYYPEGML